MKKEYANPMIAVTSFTTEHIEAANASTPVPQETNLMAARKSLSGAAYLTEIEWTF